LRSLVLSRKLQSLYSNVLLVKNGNIYSDGTLHLYLPDDSSISAPFVQYIRKHVLSCPNVCLGWRGPVKLVSPQIFLVMINFTLILLARHQQILEHSESTKTVNHTSYSYSA
jgi:hypothetical protein